MIKFAIDINSPDQSGFIPEFSASGNGSFSEYFSQDGPMQIWIRPVVASDENSLVPWTDDYVAGDIYYLAIGNVDARPTGGTFTLALIATSNALAFDITAAALQTQLDTLSQDDGYGGLVVTLLVEGVYQVDWNNLGAVPAMTGDEDLLIPASQVLITQTRAGGVAQRAQQVIDIRQAAVATATLTTAFVATQATGEVITVPSATQNAVLSISFGDAFDGYLSIEITAGGVTASVNVAPYFNASEFALALALHPAIYFQDAVEPDNISVEFVNGNFLVTFIGTLGGASTVRTITGITADTAAVVTTSAAHNYISGDSVVISGTDSTPTINGTHTITVLSATTFSVPVTTTVVGTVGSIYNVSQPSYEIDDTNAIYPKGNTGTLNCNTFALAKAFWNTTDDELTYSLQIKRVRLSGESKTIFGDSITLKRELIDVGTLINVPETGLLSLTIGRDTVASGELILVDGDGGNTLTITIGSALNTWTFTLPNDDGTSGQVLTTDGAGVTSWTTNGVGTVSSVGQTFTGGLISVSGSPITSSGTLALTVAGTSGGIPYFSGGATWASSALLAANSLMKGGGAGAAPSTITTGTGVLTALGVNTGSAGAMVLFNGALGTPSSGTLTSATGLPISTGVSGLGTGVAAFLASATSANLATALADETGTGSVVFAISPTFRTSVLVNNPANTFAYTVTPAAIVANRVLNLPLITATDTLATLGLAQTFTAVQSISISGSGTAVPMKTYVPSLGVANGVYFSIGVADSNYDSASFGYLYGGSGSSNSYLSLALYGQAPTSRTYATAFTPGSNDAIDLGNSSLGWKNFYLAGAMIATPQALSGAGAINLTTTATDYTSTGVAQALTLANGTVGQIKTITHTVDGGGGILTPTTKSGYTTITFNNAGDSVTLRYCTTAGWCIIGSYGAVIA